MLKNSDELNGMREAGKLAAEVLEMITEYVKPGISTGELDEICFKYITCLLYTSPSPRDY